MPTKHRETRRQTLGDVVAAAYHLGNGVAPESALGTALAARYGEPALGRGNNARIAVALSGLAYNPPHPKGPGRGHLDKKTMNAFRRALLDRKRDLLRRRRGALADEGQLLAEREHDQEDRAAIQTAAAMLEGLSETERSAIMRIQASLDRIAQGTYGTCVACHAPIGRQRLRALPDATRCCACAAMGH